ncbi:hypothetical protein [Teichococcus deserti]|uniref:hypothetical protein n=1 Tax=Teichococcus deserti TaxID=1817963 RepID=UPI00105576A6|nr:hypothetical protein [Pseudoroseomonas deserti]
MSPFHVVIIADQRTLARFDASLPALLSAGSDLIQLSGKKLRQLEAVKDELRSMVLRNRLPDSTLSITALELAGAAIQAFGIARKFPNAVGAVLEVAADRISARPIFADELAKQNEAERRRTLANHSAL